LKHIALASNTAFIWTSVSAPIVIEPLSSLRVAIVISYTRHSLVVASCRVVVVVVVDAIVVPKLN